MQYIDFHRSGDAEELCLASGKVPNVRKDEILIKVYAAGVNRPDILQRIGVYAPPADASKILGLEASGQVAAFGKDVEGWSVGDRVCALCNGGAYAEYVAVPIGQCLPIPDNLSFLEAAGLPETFFTVWSNVFQCAGLKAGESLLVHGGGSGIGVTAIQFAKALGAEVYVTTRTAEKCLACEDLGATLAINVCEQDFVDEVMIATDKKGVDVILDMVGGEYIQKNIDCAALNARLVSIAFLNGSKIEVNLMQMMLKRLTLTGSTLRPKSSEVKALIAAELRQFIWPLLFSGQITPCIDRIFNLSDAADAHRYMESNQHFGKIILAVR
ncbi:MAG: NAD(P)H-quinone oxidoreductase [Porticoccaceae bacterium]|nr:NAD(P)H-quinone oxidoreductase [Porticoccaceae bacterium]|tara:strand:+ start:3637 stop:4617 length:981 start_codon:yes stop_codon:yes gene_type:complete